MSEFLPPAATWSGQAAVFHRPLEGVDREAYCLLSRVDFNAPEYSVAPAGCRRRTTTSAAP